jgi:hypothetical protein
VRPGGVTLGVEPAPEPPAPRLPNSSVTEYRSEDRAYENKREIIERRRTKSGDD